MPRCVECQAEVPRDEMRGAADDLRCAACAARYAEIYYAPRQPSSRPLPPLVTIAICVAAVVVTLVYWRVPQARHYLTTWPASAVWSGEVWRLFSDALPHTTELHLLFNVYWMWRWGRVLEGWLGPWRYAGLVLLLAGGSSAVSFLFGEYGVGLSGVGFGLFGLLLALRRQKSFAAEELQPAVVFLWVFWFFLCIVGTYANFMAVGNIAHGAGLVLGWLFGRAVLQRRQILLVSAVSLLAVGLVGATQYMPWDRSYDIYRANRCIQRGDLEGASYWFKKANLPMPTDDDGE